MSYKIDRLEKSKNREGDDRIFISLQISDEHGIYPYATWLLHSDIELLKAEMQPADWEAWTRYSEFKFINPASSALELVVADVLVLGNQHQADSKIEKEIDQAKRLREAQGG